MGGVCLWVGVNVTQITVPLTHTELEIVSAPSPQTGKAHASYDTKQSGESLD